MSITNGTHPTNSATVTEFVEAPHASSSGALLGSFSEAGASSSAALLEQIASTADAESAAALRRLVQDITTMGAMINTPGPDAVAQFQQTQRRTQAFAESQQRVETAAVAALNELLTYKRDAPALGPLAASTMLSPDVVQAWAAQAQQVGVAFEELSLRLDAHYALIT